jgi:D-hexose-6-phosphate mutarotase
MTGRKGKGRQSRQRAAREDADVGNIQKDIERVYGLPPGSVQIVDPATKRNIRDDAKIKRVRES